VRAPHNSQVKPPHPAVSYAYDTALCAIALDVS
jgi:hypothetical protein